MINIDIIELYLVGRLSVKEQKEFEERLKEDSELMKEYLKRKKIHDAISEENIMDLRFKLNKIKKSRTIVRRMYRNPLVVYSAAAVILILVVIGNFYLFSNKISGSELFNSYYLTYPVLENYRSETVLNNREQIHYNAFNAFEKGNYQESEEYFRQLLDMDKSNPSTQFYMAMCEIELDKLNKSKQRLKELIKENNHAYFEQAHWYLALTYLKQNELKKAIKILEIIVEKDMVNRVEAESILESLD
jgi:tetratricopeptide (TPR) repeat protein